MGPSDKESACNVGDMGLIPESRRSPERGNGNPLQYSSLENPMDRGAWRVIVHEVSNSQTQLSTHAYMYTPPEPPSNRPTSHLEGVTECQIELPVLCSNFSLAVWFTDGNIYVSKPLLQFVSPSPSLTLSTSLFSMSVSLFLPCK